MRSRKLGELTFQEIKEYLERYSRLILPVGTLEAHGPHLPIATDTICATGLAHEIAEDLDALTAPPIHYGVTNSLIAYPGSNTIKEETFYEVIFDILKGFSDFSEIIILNGHGGNNTPLDKVLKDYTKINKDQRLSLIHWWVLGREIAIKCLHKGIGHAGSDETALIQAFSPNLVLPNKIPDEKQVTYIREGIRSYPLPGTILLYSEDDEFTKLPTEDESLDFVKELSKRIVEIIEESRKKLDDNF